MNPNLDKNNVKIKFNIFMTSLVLTLLDISCNKEFTVETYWIFIDYNNFNLNLNFLMIVKK